MALANPRFEDSYARIFGQGIGVGEGADEFFEAFYEKFLRDPDVAQLFINTDLQRQVSMLKKSLFQLVTFYVVGEPTAELERLAKLHAGIGISQPMMDAWMQALIDTAAEFDSEFDEATRLAWCWALAPGITYMQMRAAGHLSAAVANQSDPAN